jgi:6-phosphogluconolactonase (cycloisomerase 2 family)
MKYLSLVSFALLFSATNLFGQGSPCPSKTFIYSARDIPVNEVKAFCIDANGSLSEITGSPFLTNGLGRNGGLVATSRSAITPDSTRLYVSNNESGTVSGFNIDRDTGFLTTIAGSPWTIPGVSLAGSGMSFTPDDKFLFIGRSNSSQIVTASVNPVSGALTVISTTDLISSSPINGVVASPDGRYLAVAYSPLGSATNELRKFELFHIFPDGSISRVEGSPFDTASDPAFPALSNTSFVFNRDSSRVYLAYGSSFLDVFSIDSIGVELFQRFEIPIDIGNGTLTSSQTLIINSAETAVYGPGRDVGSIRRYSLDETGLITGVEQLAIPGNPIVKLAINKAGNQIFSVGRNYSINSYSIDSLGALTPAPGNPFGSPAGPSLDLSEPCVPDVQIKAPSTGRVNLSLKGPVTVSIMSSPCFFNPAEYFDLATARFGTASPQTSRKGIRTSMQDLDGDGYSDLTLFFQVSQSGLNKFSTEVNFTIRNKASVEFSSIEEVRIVK